MRTFISLGWMIGGNMPPYVLWSMISERNICAVFMPDERTGYLQEKDKPDDIQSVKPRSGREPEI